MLGHITQHEIRERQALERRIARTIVEDCLRAGYRLNVNNGGDTDELASPSTDKETILKAMFLTDEEHLRVFRLMADTGEPEQAGWVFFVYGSDGWDVVNDYSVNLEPIMIRANKLADRYS